MIWSILAIVAGFILGLLVILQEMKNHKDRERRRDNSIEVQFKVIDREGIDKIV